MGFELQFPVEPDLERILLGLTHCNSLFLIASTAISPFVHGRFRNDHTRAYVMNLENVG